MSNCNEITVVSVVPNNFQSNKENKSLRRAPIPIAPRPPSCNVDKMPGAADISEGGLNFKTNKTLKRRTGVQTAKKTSKIAAPDVQNLAIKKKDLGMEVDSNSNNMWEVEAPRAPAQILVDSTEPIDSTSPLSLPY